MMKTLLISLPAEATDLSLVGRFPDLAEDIHRKFAPDGIAEVPDMDSACTELHIVIPATRHLGTVTTFVTKSLRQHRLLHLTRIYRVD